MGHTALFIGCGDGLADPHFETIRTWMRVALRNCTFNHYQLVRDQELSATDRWPAEEPIRAIAYGKEYADLAPFLRKLAVDAEARRSAGCPGAQLLMAQQRFRDELSSLSGASRDDPASYLSEVLARCAELVKVGGILVATTTAVDEYHRVKDRLQPDEKARCAIKVAEMLLSNSQAFRALQVLDEIRPNAELAPTSIRERLVALYADCARMLFDLDGIAVSASRASEAGDRRSLILAAVAEAEFLMGDLDSAATTARKT